MSSAEFSPDGTRIVTASYDKTARIWDSAPHRERFPTLDRARAAAAKMGPIVEARLKAGASPETLTAAVASDKGLLPEERTAAQAALFAATDRARILAGEAMMLNNSAWNAVRDAPVRSEAATEAVANARRAVELAPEHGFYINTLGVALYRAGQFREALDTLVRADGINAKSKNGPLPSDWAFMAMVHWKLGNEAEARAALAKLRDLSTNDRWKADEETRRHLAEAEALIAVPP